MPADLLSAAAARARAECKALAADLADYARSLADHDPGRGVDAEHVELGRVARLKALDLLNTYVVRDYLEGASWQTIAVRYGRPTEWVQATYQPIVDAYVDGEATPWRPAVAAEPRPAVHGRPASAV